MTADVDMMSNGERECEVHKLENWTITNGHNGSFTRLLPTAGWIKKAWQASEDELLQYSGLDGVVFMRIITFSLKVICIAGFIGIFILISVNYSANQLHDMDYINISNKILEAFSISNVNNGSDSLWIHLGAVYYVTISCVIFPISAIFLFELNDLTLNLSVRHDEINRFNKSLSQKSKVKKAIELVRMSKNVISRMLMSERCSEYDNEAGEMRKLDLQESRYPGFREKVNRHP
nr:CSC1-like protein At1g69450 [Tanacetum cinerariifolium]